MRDTLADPPYQGISKACLKSFQDRLEIEGLELKRSKPAILQINVGKLCNLTCMHCHVNAGPGRKEIMGIDTMARVLAWFNSTNIQKVDITGGAPEMVPGFRFFIDRIREIRPEAQIIDRCNLTILLESGYEGLAEFLAERRVEIVASMPCYQPENVEAQRGNGVFDVSIQALQLLNSIGYGKNPELRLNLVYNPLGPSLPPDQSELEADYKEALRATFDIEFDQLYTITNMPIARFLAYLRRENRLDEYMDLLVENFNPAAVEGLMCRDTISVDWQGRVFDCDFNQMLNLPFRGNEDLYLWDLSPLSFEGGPVQMASHCFGCTAGAGSSCGGSLD